MGPIIHRLPAKEEAAHAAHFELMKRRLLSGMYAARQQQYNPLNIIRQPERLKPNK